jgi:hypothetical protein
MVLGKRSRRATGEHAGFLSAKNVPRELVTASGEIRPWRSTGMDGSLPLDSVRAGRMPTTEEWAEAV